MKLLHKVPEPPCQSNSGAYKFPLSTLPDLISSSRAWGGKRGTRGPMYKQLWCPVAQQPMPSCRGVTPLTTPLVLTVLFNFLPPQSASPSNTALQICVRPCVRFKEVACPSHGLHDAQQHGFHLSQKIKRCGGYKLDCTCMCLCFYPSIYHGGALVNHQCQAAEWEMFYKCCLSGGRRPSPGGFNHPPNPPHPDSLHPSISPSAEVLMSS